jgi:hypothetical protein
MAKVIYEKRGQIAYMTLNRLTYTYRRSEPALNATSPNPSDPQCTVTR